MDGVLYGLQGKGLQSGFSLIEITTPVLITNIRHFNLIVIPFYGFHEHVPLQALGTLGTAARP
jgi:hypothetical protein